MKYWIVLLLVLCLIGCSALAPNEYLSVTPHVEEPATQIMDTAALNVENYESMKIAIMQLIRTGTSDGMFRITNYDGDVEADLAKAAYEVSKLDPVGAYAVDYITHSCTRIVSYYEIQINMTFRRTPQDIRRIESVSTQLQLRSYVENAIDSGADRLALRLKNYQNQAKDISDIVLEHCAEAATGLPEVSVQVYPDSGSDRIMEIEFQHIDTPAEPPETSE